MGFEILTVAEAAERARVSRRHMVDEIKEGRGTSVTMIQAATRIRTDVLEDWLSEWTIQRPAPIADEVAA